MSERVAIVVGAGGELGRATAETASSIRRTEMAGQPGGHEEPDADLPHHLRRGLIPCQKRRSCFTATCTRSFPSGTLNAGGQPSSEHIQKT